MLIHIRRKKSSESEKRFVEQVSIIPSCLQRRKNNENLHRFSLPASFWPSGKLALREKYALADQLRQRKKKPFTTTTLYPQHH